MFRVLSNDELNNVKKWQAPRLSESDTPSNPLAGLSKQLPVEEETTTDITNIRKVVADAQGSYQASNDDSTVVQDHSNESSRSHASLTMSNPSADMLQQTYDEGYSAGIQAGESKTDAVTAKALLNILADLAPQKYQIDTDIEQELVLLAKAIAKILLQREVESDDSVILDLVKSALAKVPMVAEPPIVILNPIDLDIVQNMQTSPVQAKFKPDSDLKRGGCRIESGASTLEAGIDALIESISSSTAVAQNDTEVDEINSANAEKVDE